MDDIARAFKPARNTRRDRALLAAVAGPLALVATNLSNCL